MLSIQKAREEFDRYVSGYNKDDFKIALKINHSYRTASYARQIAKSIGADEDLAELIGLLHDIGRFEQIRIYNTFSDSQSVDHADLGVEILETDNYIEKYCDDKQTQELIIKAVKYHNKYKIADDIEGDELTYCKLIRDADKIDILNYMEYEDITKLFDFDAVLKDNISDNVYKEMLESKVVNRYDAKTALDDYMLEIGFIYDVNYDISIELIKRNKSMDKLCDLIKDAKEKDKVNDIREHVAKYMDERISNIK